MINSPVFIYFTGRNHALHNMLFVSSQKVLGRMGMTTGISLWSGSGSCWVLPTLHQFWPWLATGFEFCRRKPELRCFLSSGSFDTFTLSSPIISGSSPFFRWKAFEPTPLTGLRTSRICLWIFAFREGSMTLSSDIAGGATTTLAAMVQMVTRRVKKNRVRLNLNPIPLTPTPLANRGPDQRQTPRPLRQTKCLRRKAPRPQTPACLSPWITLGKTWHLLMSLQMLRAVNYI